MEKEKYVWKAIPCDKEADYNKIAMSPMRVIYGKAPVGLSKKQVKK